MSWSGLTNGKLLDKAQDQFDAFVTSDQNLAFQQNFNRFNITVYVLHPATGKLDDLKQLVPQLVKALHRPNDKIIHIH